MAAIGGYWKQYEYSACRVYRLMQDGDLEGITIAEPSAGIFDDLLVHMGQQVHATQIKTTQDAGYVTLATALTADRLIRRMADAWLGLEEKFGTGKVRLKYIFAGFFSTDDISLSNRGATGARHSAEFARFISKQDGGNDTTSLWSVKLGELQVLSGLDEQQFSRFVASLELCDGAELARNRIENFQPDHRGRIEAIRDLFPTLVTIAASKRTWSENELVEKLGWRSRLSQFNVHEFPVPPDFQENTSTEARLLETLQQASGGYITLCGPPGTGKSTLLQRSIYSTACYSVSRYLAFHPDQRHGLGRAEAGEFLNDMIAELKSQGFYGSRFAQEDLSNLRSELRRQLDQASRRFQETGRKTVIVIDGLDHVWREENPDFSFLKELPAANAVPSGVLFVLGTQRLDLPDLHPTIIQQASGSERRVVIDPLSRNAIFQMANAAGVPPFVEREALFDACQGHPLTARYFIEALKGASSSEDADGILSHADGLGRSLEQIYERVWAKLGTADATKSALGILARAEGHLSPEQLAHASSDDAVDDVLQRAGFLLARRNNGRLAIFHNSFRLFVAEATGRRFGKPDPDAEKRFNRLLAEIASAAPAEDSQHWMELRYRARAGEDAAVLRIGTPDYFRRSLAAFRPYSEINNDLRLTYGAVKPTRDRVALLNKLLISKEIEYRVAAVSDLDLVGLFLDLGDVDLAIKHALETGSAGDGWLRLVDHLWEAGEYESARQVFEANEPLEVLFGGQGFDRQVDLDEALNWIQRAQRFRSIDKLAALIDSMSIKLRHFSDDDGAADRKDLKFRLALGVVTDHPDADIEALQNDLSLSPSEVACLTMQAAAGAADRDHDTALERLSKAISMPETATLHSSWKREAAFVAHKIVATELAGRFAAMLTIPRLDDDQIEYGGDSVEVRCREIYDTVVLGGLTGTNLPDQPLRPRGERSDLLTNANKKIRELGELRAKAKTENAGQVVAALKRIILFFATARPDAGDFQGYRFFPTLGWLPDPILRIARELGREALEEIVAFIDETTGQGNNLSGSLSFRLKFASLVFELDGDIDGARKRVESTQPHAPEGRTPQEVVASQADVARAFNSIGLAAEAHAVLSAIHRDTFGYWLRAKKEPQYTFWAWSFINACRTSPARAETNALEFARFILGMDETEGDGTAMRLVPDLLLGAGAVPSAAAGIASRLIESDLTSWAGLADSVLASIATHDGGLAASALDVFGRLVVPFFHDRLDRCIPACLKALRPADRAEPVERLVAAVARWCPPSQRAALLELVVECATEIGDKIAPALLRAKETAQSLSRVEHGNGSNSTESSVSLDVEVSNFSELLARGEGNSEHGDGVDYSYGRAAERLAGAASNLEIESFFAARPHLERDAKVMVTFAKRLLNLGDRAGALRFFDKAEKAAEAGYWSSFLGGQKLELQNLRIELEGDPGREKGFDVLLAELATGQTSGPTLFLNLDEVLEKITVDLPYEAFWIETEGHLKQYREYRLAAPVEPLIGIGNHTDLLAFIVAKAFSFSCPEILGHARAAAALVACREEGAGFLRKLIELLKQQTGGNREAAALMFQLRTAPNLRGVLCDEAKKAASDDDFVVSSLARRVLSHLDEPMEDSAVAPLPPFYRLVMSDSDQAMDFEPPPGVGSGQRPVWSDDPWTWTAFLRFPFRVLSDHCDISLDLLRRRCAEFMRKEGGRSAFGPEVEAAILAQLRRMSLQFTYRRALPMAAVRGFGKVLQELSRAEAVDPRVFLTVWPEIGGPSLSGFRIEPKARPEWASMPALPRREHGGIKHDEWLATAEDSLCSVLAPDHFVLAEESFFRVRVWRESAECSKLVLPAPLNLEDGVAGLPRLISLDDLRPLYHEDSNLVCRIPNDLFGDLDESAMTICPYAARSLGWSRSKATPFELCDPSGAVVARTVLWVDGTNTAGWRDTELYGRGQAVLLTANGRLQVEASYGPISCGASVTRRVMSESKDTNHRMVIAPGKQAPEDLHVG